MKINHRTLILAATTALLGAGACDRKDDGIRTYDAPKEPPVVVAKTEIHWKVPPEWKALPPAPMSKATYLVAADPPLTMTISRFSGMGSPEETLLANVNRWNGQVGRPPVTEADLPQLLTVSNADGHGVFAAELSSPEGVAPAKRMLFAIVLEDQSAWAFKILGPAEQVAPHKAEFDQVVRSINYGGAAAAPAPVAEKPATPPADKPAAPPPAGDVPPINGITSMSLPEGWQLLPPKPGGGFGGRTITFTEGDFPGQVVITRMGAGSLVDMIGNINRWRGQVLLPETTNEADHAPQPLAFAQGPGVIREFSGPEGGKGPRLRQWVAYTQFPKSDTVWFFRLVAPYDLATKTKPAFDKFVASIKFEDAR